MNHDPLKTSAFFIKKLSGFILLTLIALLGGLNTVLANNPGTPKLIVQLVVDQLRGDLIDYYQPKFGQNGFNYLLTHGINYHNTYHPHANTVTCVGHATIATGSNPSLHGIIGNEWYDRQEHHSVNCVEDRQSPILPTQRTHTSLSGRSPHYLMASTLSDEILLAQKGRAFSVAFKDRSAITLAGHAGKAFWFDPENGGFITSQYYYSTYPQWVIQWDNHYKPNTTTWELSKPLDAYRFAKSPTFSHRFDAFGQTFPHSLGQPDSTNYYQFLSQTPFADELTAAFAIELLKQEKLGTEINKTDYLAISFATLDVVGHTFGPNSLESEDSLLRLDKTLAQFFSALDNQVGLENTLIVLTADHGVTDSPPYLAANKMITSQALEAEDLQKIIERSLTKKSLQLPANTLQSVSLPYIYLDHKLIHQHRLSVSYVTAYLANVLRQVPGIYQVYTLPLNGTTKIDWLSEKIDKMLFPNRTGDLYLVSLPYQAFSNRIGKKVSHGTPWNYDRYVPLLFANPHFKTQRITRATSTTHIAPSLAALLSIKFPSASMEQPLPEVMKAFSTPPLSLTASRSHDLFADRPARSMEHK